MNALDAAKRASQGGRGRGGHHGQQSSLKSASMDSPYSSIKSDKNRYDREFLSQMKDKATEKQEGIPQIVYERLEKVEKIIKTTIVSSGNKFMIQYVPQIDNKRRSIDNKSYPFEIGSMGKRGGEAGGGPCSQISNMNNNQLQSQQDVKLSTTENAYKPVKMVNTQLDETERVLRGVRTILNKLTPQNFQKLVSDLVQMEINVNEDRLRGTIDIIFEKSIDEPAFSQTYANLCKALNTVRADYLTYFVGFFNFFVLFLKDKSTKFE